MVFHQRSRPQKPGGPRSAPRSATARNAAGSRDSKEYYADKPAFGDKRPSRGDRRDKPFGGERAQQRTEARSERDNTFPRDSDRRLRRDGERPTYRDERPVKAGSFDKKRKSFGEARGDAPRYPHRDDARDTGNSRGNDRRPSFRDKAAPSRKSGDDAGRKLAYAPKRRPDTRKPSYDSGAATGGPSPDRPPSRDSVLIWGQHAVKAAWLNKDRRCYRLRMTESAQAAFAPVLKAAEEHLLKRPDPGRAERHDLDRLTPAGSVHQGIVLEAAPLPEPSLHDVIGVDQPPELLLMLDQVTDPHNVGAILRSAAGFGAGAVIMTERNAPSTTGVLAKSASGALEHVPQIHVVNLARALDDLQQAGYWCVGLAEEAEKDLSELDLTGRTVLVLGAEGEGLRQLTRKKCNELARLPSGGPIGSLNVSNAAAVSLYEVRRQKKKAR